MDNTNTGGPAFPAGAHFGMTLRDYFAGQALAGCLAGSNRSVDSIPLLSYGKAAEDCYAYADAMLAEREAKQ